MAESKPESSDALDAAAAGCGDAPALEADEQFSYLD